MTLLLFAALALPTHTPAAALAQHPSLVMDGVYRERSMARWRRAWAKHSHTVNKRRNAARNADTTRRAAGSTGRGAPAYESAPNLSAPGQTYQGSNTFTASAYAPGCGDTGQTATGSTPHYGTVAVDPSVIPLGSSVYIPGYGAGTAEDTGGAIQGMRVDLWFPTCAEALAWGVQNVVVSW